MKNKLKSKTIALIGIVMYVLGVILSAEDLQGNPRFPPILRLISDTGLLVFIIMAIVRLWRQTRLVALTLMISTILCFVLGVIQQITSSVTVLFNVSRLISLIALLWTIIALLQKQDVGEGRMNKIIGKIMFGVGFLIGASLLITGFLAYFITQSRNGVIIDGLGRSLSESPLLLRIMFGQDRLWPGFGWFVTDMIIFWGGVGLIYLLFTKGAKFSVNDK